MSGPPKLSKNLTVSEFDRGYWYADEIKAFARAIGITNSSKLRKDELEELIKHFLKTGEVRQAHRKNIVKTGRKDLELGLTSSLPVVHYTSNKETKGFIISEANKLLPGLKIRSGVWYRLNRWRDEQITIGKKINYGDLISEFIRLNRTEGKFKKAEVGRYINFLSEFLANEQGATRTQAIREWKKLKDLNIEKNYRSWKKYGEK